MIKHRLDFTAKQDDFDEHGKIKLSSLLYYCQEVAKGNVDAMGIGMDDLLKQNLAWILAKMKLRILGDFVQGAEYYVVTYPRKPKSRFCPRDYYIYDIKDELKAVGSSMWGLMDLTSRKITKINLDFGDDLREDEPFPEGFEKIRIKDEVKSGEYTVTSSDIDTNMHTNNCRYADMAQQVSSIYDVKEFSIQFSKETKENEVIDLYTEDLGDEQIACGRLPDGQTVFISKTTTK